MRDSLGTSQRREGVKTAAGVISIYVSRMPGRDELTSIDYMSVV